MPDEHDTVRLTPSTAQAHRWFPGYTVAAVSAVALVATAPGQTFLVSQLNAPLAAELGIAPLTINGAYAVATVAAALPLVMIGRMTDRVGPRRAIAIVAGAFAVACAVMAGAQGLVGVAIGFFLLRFLGQGALSLVAQHALAMWFHRRLGSVQGIKIVVLFTAWAPLPLLTATMIDGIGWRTTYLIFGAAVAALCIPLALRFVRDRPEDLGLRMDNDAAPLPLVSSVAEQSGAATDLDEELPEPTGAGPFPGYAEQDGQHSSKPHADWSLREAGRTPAFWIITASFFLSPLIGTALLFDMGRMLESGGGSALAAATPVSVWTVTMAIMALPAGLLTDRVRAATLVCVGMLLIGAGPLAMFAQPHPVGASVAMILFAVGQSLVAASGSAAVARYFGRTHHGAIRASMARIGVVGAGIGPLGTGLSVALTGGYAVALIAFAVVCLPVAVAAVWLRPPHTEHPRG